MIKKTVIENKNITLFAGNGSTDRPLVVLNTYQDEGKRVWDACQELHCPSFFLLSVGKLRWDDDMTPWPIPPISADDTPCGGLADAYLEILTGQILPWAIWEIPHGISYQVIAGYSLAGLFALYCLYRTDAFSRAASASGSLWYPHFVEYAKQNEIRRKPEKVYLSLGDRESQTQNKYLSPVEARTREMERYFAGEGIKTLYESNPGDHYHDAIRRMARGICGILEETA